jgi:X-X-X-Leu-X-X-Gly heptad repeat protein
MAEKQVPLSIVLRTVDKATAGIIAVNKRIDAITRPTREFGKALSDLGDKSGLNAVGAGFAGVGGALKDLLGKFLLVGGAAGAAVLGLKSLVDEFDDLGDKAEAAGVSVDFFAQLRFAAERSGAEVATLDSGLTSLASGLGQARTGAGKFYKFINEKSPALARQVKAAKDNEAAFNLLANAAAKLTDKAKLAAFAQKTLGDASLGPLLAKGSKGIDELRQRYLELAGSQEGAAGEAGKVDDAMKDLKAATDGIKAALVVGLAPALGLIVEKLRAFFTENRSRIAQWAADLGKKLPGAIAKLIDVFGGIVDAVRPFVDSTTKLKIIAVALAAVILGPLIASIVSLGIALLTTPVGWIVLGIAAIAAGAYLLIKNWDSVSAFFVGLWESIRGAFGAAWEWINEKILGPIIDPIIKAWQPLKDGFVMLWDGITSVFTRAWEIIKSIVDKVTGAVDAVTGAVGRAIDFVNPFSDDSDTGGARVSDVASRAVATLNAARAQATEARVTVDFANAPRGTRVSSDPQSTADVDLSVGYQMLGGA